MFGKPEWFTECCKSKRLIPATWQGWLYALVCLAATILPAMLLIAASRVPEAAIWGVVVAAFVYWDLRRVHMAKCQAGVDTDDVLYIGDDDNSSLATRNFEMRLRN